MSKIWAIAWKELYTTLRDRNLILVMLATPLVLSTIIGLAFGGLGSDNAAAAIETIPLAVVNLDTGFDLQQQLPANNSTTQPFDLSTITFTVDGAVLNLGEQLRQNATISATGSQSLTTGDVAFNYGDLLASILLSQPLSATSGLTGSPGGGLNLGALACPLVASSPISTTFSGQLSDLLASQAISDGVAARAGVDAGAYAAAVIIPPNFSQQLLPSFGPALAISTTVDLSSTVEVYANSGRPIAATVVRSIVEGIVNQLLRTKIALTAMGQGANDTLLNGIDSAQVDATAVVSLLQSANLSQTLAALSCLFTPNAGNLTLRQQPLDRLQEGNRFVQVIASIGSAQAVFFALFTGAFGLLGIYQERKQGTLQRLLVSPTPRQHILWGLLLGNLIVVVVQLLLLLAALTVIASLISGTPTLIWGTNLPLLLLVVLALALCVSGVGVLVVGLARSPQQVQLVAPMINIGLGAIGGSFGFDLPTTVAQFSLIYWGVDALTQLAQGQAKIGLNLLVLLGLGTLLFGVGSWLFKRRLEL